MERARLLAAIWWSDRRSAIRVADNRVTSGRKSRNETGNRVLLFYACRSTIPLPLKALVYPRHLPRKNSRLYNTGEENRSVITASSSDSSHHVYGIQSTCPSSLIISSTEEVRNTWNHASRSCIFFFFNTMLRCWFLSIRNSFGSETVRESMEKRRSREIIEQWMILLPSIHQINLVCFSHRTSIQRNNQPRI